MKRVPLVLSILTALLSGAILAQVPATGVGPSAPAPDPFVAKQRVIVMTDIANEPDDQMSLVRFLLYSNEFDVEGLVATTSTWMKNRVRPDVINAVLDGYEAVQPNLLKHGEGFPQAAALRHAVTTGQPAYGMAGVGPDKLSPGAQLILLAAQRPDPRPLWILAWGGTNTLAQALLSARTAKPAGDLEAIVSKLRVYAISDQDDAGPWIRREFPALHYIVTPSTQDGQQYDFATWTGISGDRFYRNAPGADFTTFTEEWVNEHVRSHGPLGKLYPVPCCIHEGDSPSFLGLLDNGLAGAMSPTYGGWGGRYVWRQPNGEPRPFWTQGGDSYPGNDSSRDTVTGADGRAYTSDQATIWRWRKAFQNDMAARMDWTIRGPREANHNPRVALNGVRGTAPLVLDAQVGAPVTLDAAGTADPDDDALTFTWFFYPEAGTGIPGQPVAVRRRPGGGNLAKPGEGGVPPAARAGGPGEPSPRVVIDHASSPRATVMPKVAGIAHIILAVEDAGSPSLTSYRRVILRIRDAARDESTPASSAGRVQLAVTFDDLPVHAALPPGVDRADVARTIISALREHGVPSVYGFVNAKGLEESPANAEVLRLWRAAGQPLGNHTFSHMDLNANDAVAFEQDIVANEAVLRTYMGDEGWRWLRFPYLREGNTPEKRNAVAGWLKERGYRVAKADVSFDDWAYNDPYARCAAKEDKAAIDWMKERYLQRAEASLATTREADARLYGRDIPHVMLLHLGAFDAVMMPRLLDLFAARKVTFVTLEQASGFNTDRAVGKAEAASPRPPATTPDDTLTRLSSVCR